jgi:hypothetical protein
MKRCRNWAGEQLFGISEQLPHKHTAQPLQLLRLRFSVLLNFGYVTFPPPLSDSFFPLTTPDLADRLIAPNYVDIL